MELIIDIPYGAYEEICSAKFPAQDTYRMVAWIKDGRTLSKGHGRKQHEMVEDRIHCDCGCEMVITGNWDKFKFCPTCGVPLEHNEDYDYSRTRRIRHGRCS